MKKYYKIVQILNESILSVPENYDLYRTGNETAKRYKSKLKYEWMMYSGGNDWEPDFKYLAVYISDKPGEATRIWIRVKYPPKLDNTEGNEKIKDLQTEFGKKLADKWILKAKKINSYYKNLSQNWHKKMDEENKKLDLYRSKGLQYERDVPPIPKHKGDWKISFGDALKDEELSNYIDETGIDHTKWEEKKL